MLRRVSTKMGSAPWVAEGAGKPASTQLNVVLIRKAHRDASYQQSACSPAPGMRCSARLRPGGDSETDRQAPCLPTDFSWQLTDPTSPLAEARVIWQPPPLGPWREPNPKRKTGVGREEFQHRLGLAHSVYLGNRSVFPSSY